MIDRLEGPDLAFVAILSTEIRVLMGKLRRTLRAQASTGGLTASQIAVLGHLERDGPATVSVLARAEGVRPQSMGATVAALEDAGLVQGDAHPDDGRQTVLSLTSACKDWIHTHRAARDDFLQRAIQARLSPGEQQQLLHAITLLRRLTEP